MGLMENVPKVLDPLPGGSRLADAVDYVVNWARSRSIWPLTFGTSCCAIEMMAASMARYDISRFGSEVFRASPRQADLFIVAGTTETSRTPSSIRARMASPMSSGVMSSMLHSIWVIVGSFSEDSPRNARSMSAIPSAPLLPNPTPILS